MSERDDFRDFVASRRQAWLHSAWLLTGDWHTAEDLVQASLLRTFPHWRRIAADAPDAYVRRVIVNLHASWWRRRWRGEVPTGLLPERLDTNDPFANADQRELVLRALRQLAPRQRATLVLRYFDDLAEAEVAAVMNCSIGTVKSQTAKALAQLRRDGVLLQSQRNEVPHGDSR